MPERHFRLRVALFSEIPLLNGIFHLSGSEDHVFESMSALAWKPQKCDNIQYKMMFRTYEVYHG